MEYFVQISGAILVLVGYGLGQLGKLDTHSRFYLGINLAGSALLAFDAWRGGHWGFLVLNVTWVLVAAISLVSTIVRAEATSEGAP